MMITRSIRFPEEGWLHAGRVFRTADNDEMGASKRVDAPKSCEEVWSLLQETGGILSTTEGVETTSKLNPGHIL